MSCQHIQPKFAYPDAQKGDVVDNYHGTTVADPYRWLEDDNSKETAAWVEAQNAVTDTYLTSIPQRASINQRLTTLWNYERFGVPSRHGGRYVYFKNNGLQNQDVLFKQPTLATEATVLLDPNTLSEDGTVSLGSISFSEDGKLLAYSISESGSDWRKWKVRNVDTGEDLDDLVEWSKFSDASWAKDGSGFYYSRYDEPAEDEALQQVNYFQKLYFHRVGTTQSEDTLIYERPDQKEWGFGGGVSEDGRYLIISVWEGTDPKNRVFYRDLQDANGPVIELLNDFDAEYSFLGNEGPVFWFKTNLDADRGRIIAIDTTQPARANWRELIPESKDTLVAYSVVGDRFIIEYLRDAKSVVNVFALDGTFEREVALPGIGSSYGFGGRREDRETFFGFTSFSNPGSVYRYDIATGQAELFKKPTVQFDPADYETKQVFYTSKDGTKVPMFITHKRGLTPDGNLPTLLYGYGGFNISLTPSFSVANLVWMEMGGVYAVPNLRGGGEYGEQWHQEGTKLNKQNVFDDFIGAAEWLIANNYTSSDRLAISGGSNGGLLVGACMTQRPELFAAAMPAVGVMDMLRFHKFTIGWAWVSDYGSSDNGEEFEALYKYSPLHNLREDTSYPSTLVTTADHDDRVVPAHSFKFAATLQEKHAGENPVLIRIETKAGHGAGKPTSKRIEEAADKIAFLMKELDVK